MLPIKLAVGYLDDPKDFAELLVVSKNWRNMLFPVIMKRLLCDINRKWVPEKRKQIWKCALK